jgi:signal transduction histidine kinase
MYAAFLCHAYTAAAAPDENSQHTSFHLGEARVDGRAREIPRHGPLRVHAYAQNLTLTVRPSSENGADTRWHYRLEGMDPEWHDAGGWFRFTVRFYDRNKNVIGGEEQSLQGQSAGWTGDPATSPYQANGFHLAVPKNAHHLMVWTCSSAPLNSVGIHALRDLTAVLHAREPGAPERRTVMLLPEGDLLDRPEGTPKGWARHGTSLGFAQILPRPKGTAALVLRDESSTTFGGWLSLGEMLLPVEDVSSVTFEWKEAYSIGWAGQAYISYSHLPPGNYRLRIQPLTHTGSSLGAETVIPITVTPPFHQTLWFQCVVASAGAAGIFLITRKALRRKHAENIEAMKREQAVLDERLRIARDLHDSLGADLTHLALLSDLAQRDTQRSDKHDHNAIFDAARNLTRRVDEIVWALNPVQDSLPRFIEFVGNHTQKFLSSACMRCRLDLPLDPPALTLSSPFRHDLFLIIKELLHNVVKHSRASEVRLRLHLESEILLIAIEDNGCGFPSDFTPGNGTTTLRSRIDRLKGQMQISDTEGGGTTVRLRVPLSL